MLRRPRLDINRRPTPGKGGSMTQPDPELRNLVALLLAHEAGETGEPAQIAEAAQRICQKLRSTLSDVIGAGGFEAVAMRAVHLTAEEFPFVAGIEPSPLEGLCLGGLQESIAGRDPAQAREAITTLLYNFLTVLTFLLGRQLPFRYVHAAWPGFRIINEAPCRA